MAKKNETPPPNTDLYEKVVATIPEVERKGASIPYTSHNGNMFSALHQPGIMALRLSALDREAFLAKFNSKLFESYGIVQKEYVTVPDDLLHRTEELATYFAKSYEYVKTLKAKPTKKGG